MSNIEITNEKIIIEKSKIENGEFNGLVFDKDKLDEIAFIFNDEIFLSLKISEKTNAKIETMEGFSFHGHNLRKGTKRDSLLLQVRKELVL